VAARLFLHAHGMALFGAANACNLYLNLFEIDGGMFSTLVCFGAGEQRVLTTTASLNAVCLKVTSFTPNGLKVTILLIK
jgi:hypothetical protein